MNPERRLQAGSAESCAAAIRQARRALVICHLDPDGDAVGSLLAVGWFLQQLGIPHVLACDSPIPGQWGFLSRTGPVVSECSDGYDLAITVDCNAFDRLGRFCSPVSLANVPIVNIDHHVTNGLFGRVNWVDSQAASTAEMILDLAAPLGVSLSKDAAVCLLVGIVTDTQAFRTPNTTPRTLEAALGTMEAGASLADVVARTIDSRSFASMCLWARVVAAARLSSGVVWAEVTRSDASGCGADLEARRGLVNFLLTAREAWVAVLLTENANGTVDVSMRSKPGVDVADATQRLGGGGHLQAAGCTLTGSMDEARGSVSAALRESLAQQGMTWPGIDRQA